MSDVMNEILRSGLHRTLHEQEATEPEPQPEPTFEERIRAGGSGDGGNAGQGVSDSAHDMNRIIRNAIAVQRFGAHRD
ncbi:MAG: hypothetical protein ABI725_02305 [Chloroflexota bacterium]